MRGDHTCGGRPPHANTSGSPFQAPSLSSHGVFDAQAIVDFAEPGNGLDRGRTAEGAVIAARKRDAFRCTQG